MQTYAYGFPRLGKKREYKRVIEAFWRNELTEQELLASFDLFQRHMIESYESCVSTFPVGEITYYDSMLDTAIMVGLYKFSGLDDYYDMCRGKGALELRKWFNTNYHYLVPDFSTARPASLGLHWNKPLDYFLRIDRGIPYTIGPFTLLKLSKGTSGNFAEFMEALAEIYFQIASSVPSLHIDEPALVLQLTPGERNSIKRTYQRITQSGSEVNLFTYYDSVDNLEELYEIPFFSLGVDFVHGTGNLETILRSGFPGAMRLIAGVVDGRNIWKTDIQKATRLIEALRQKADKLVLSNAGPLFHLPVSVSYEYGLAPELKEGIAFAEERLTEVRLLAQSRAEQTSGSAKSGSLLPGNTVVQKRVADLKEGDFVRDVPYKVRSRIQHQTLGLPLFPSTTIGSFPQTKEIRAKRAAFRNGSLHKEQYKHFIKEKIEEVVRFQEDTGLDVLVHGEFERSDMVEFFAEKMEGFTCTREGWVLSYGTRAYRPPILFGDVSRRDPMTLEEICYAQSLTRKPIKGMLTGPVTILAWSFVREDIAIEKTAYQIALCLNDEIQDYQNAGIRIIQVDEPAFREGAPLKKRDWDFYYSWATKAFNLAVKSDPQTQIHTHMCYSDFGDIIQQISALDFDVISVEASRSGGEIIDQFREMNFGKQIGLGVWDIHSPVVPKAEQMQKVVRKALEVLNPDQLWVNPDCGLKTRGWEETKAALRNMVTISRIMRSSSRNTTPD